MLNLIKGTQDNRGKDENSILNIADSHLFSTSSAASLVWKESKSIRSSVTDDIAQLESRANAMLQVGSNIKALAGDSDVVEAAVERPETNLVFLFSFFWCSFSSYLHSRFK
jgi:hypothetical protein